MKDSRLNLPPLVERLLKELPDDLPVALAGGAVRDLLLNRRAVDYDFIVPGGAMRTARKLADRIGAAYYPLDEQRDYARLVVKDGEHVLIDFSSYRGADIEADLRNRDFTVNAMAIDLRQPNKLIDPTDGASDLLRRQIRPCSPSALIQDPVRVLRAARMAVMLEARLPAETLKLMREAAPAVVNVSPERIRDELFKILALAQPATALRILDATGALASVLPELIPLKGLQQSPPHVHEAWEHTLNVVSRLQSVLGMLAPIFDEEGTGSLILGLVSLRLGRYRSQLAGHFSKQLNPERSLRALLNFAALYHDVGKPLTRSVEENGRIRYFEHELAGAELAVVRGHALRLSNQEIERLRLIVRYHMRPSLLAHTGNEPSRKAVYHFFRDAKEAGVDVCLLSLADKLATYDATLTQENWARLLDVVRILLESWWECPQEVVSPPPLVDGHDVMRSLGIPPSSRLGEILEAIREAQVEGLVSTPEQALEFADDYYNRHPKS